jgi:hypothetical protein
MKTSFILACGPSLTPALVVMGLLWLNAFALFFVNLFFIFRQPEPARFSHLLVTGACALAPFVFFGLRENSIPWISKLVTLSVYQFPFVVIAQFTVLLAATIKNNDRKRRAELGRLTPL